VCSYGELHQSFFMYNLCLLLRPAFDCEEVFKSVEL
jgi:hypothetical protein